MRTQNTNINFKLPITLKDEIVEFAKKEKISSGELLRRGAMVYMQYKRKHCKK